MTAGAVEAPYGSWASPLKAERLAGAAIRLGDLTVADGQPYWVESRPAEGGRYVVVTQATPGGPIAELTPPGFNVRTAVHEYGGAAFTLRLTTAEQAPEEQIQ